MCSVARAFREAAGGARLAGRTREGSWAVGPTRAGPGPAGCGAPGGPGLRRRIQSASRRACPADEFNGRATENYVDDCGGSESGIATLKTLSFETVNFSPRFTTRCAGLA